MQRENINTPEYWEGRFSSGDWENANLNSPVRPDYSSSAAISLSRRSV